MTPNFQLIKDALIQHVLDSLGNIYTITVDDVVDYIEKGWWANVSDDFRGAGWNPAKSRVCGMPFRTTSLTCIPLPEKELSPEMTAQLAALDEVNLAIEIADAIGNAGVMELVEGVICETIKTQIAIAREAVLEAQSESEFIEEVCS